MSTANSGYNASDVGIFSDPNLSSVGFGSTFENRRSSNYSLPGADPTSFLSQNYRKFDELRRLLDNNKESLKLEAMRRIIEMVARGQNCSELFAAVVKNVVSRNTEIRKLVYVYLERYAEEQQDLALLSVSTFQKALRDSNQLIRSCALRVLSSIRVPMIAPIVMLAIKDCAQDMSPFVRKTVAHSIPKLHSLDPSQKDHLIDVIEKLMKDQFTMVIGSAIVAFEQVCPDRIVFIHQNYRKLCNVLPDIDEWGQVFVLNMLTRYARTQFLDPNRLDAAPCDPSFYSSSESSSEGSLTLHGQQSISHTLIMDPDHRLLLRASKSLLQSRNSSVVLAVVQLYYHIAPKNELSVLVRPMTRLLKSHREIRTIVLTNIATISANFPGMFEPFLRLFYITTDEPTHVKMIKLEILINIANQVNATSILREFSVYIYNDDFLFVSAAIHAIGRIARCIPEISDVCLSGLLGLLSCTDHDIAGESVIVIQRLLQLGPGQNEDVIIRLSKMLDRTENSNARASIIWMIGEHCHRVPKIAPDVLRKAAKMFLYETDPVKHQTLNLAAKLVCLNSKQTRVLCQYVFSLGRFDQSYDIRDKSRLFRNILFPLGDNIMHKYSKKLMISHKPAPLLRSPYKDREQWQLGSLSHFLNVKVAGYKPLSDFPHLSPNPTVRDVVVEYNSTFIQKPVEFIKTKDIDKFYTSHSDSSSRSDSESITDTDESYESDMTTQSSASSLSEFSVHKEFENTVSIHENELQSETDNTSDSDTSDSNEPSGPLSSKVNNSQSNCLLIDEFSGEDPSTNANILEHECNDTLLSPTVNFIDELEPVLPKFVNPNFIEVMNKYNGNGISIKYRMLRRRFLISNPSMIEVELLIENHKSATIFSDLSIIPDPDTNLQKANELGKIFPLAKVYYSVGIDFNDSIQPAKLLIRSLDNNINNYIYIHPTCGELVLPVYFPELSFLNYQKRFGGMSVTKGEIYMKVCIDSIHHKILEVCNLNPIPTSNEHTKWYAGITASNKSLVLVSIIIHSDNLVCLEVDCDHMMISDILFSIFKEILAS